jgi:hypothetical protein
MDLGTYKQHLKPTFLLQERIRQSRAAMLQNYLWAYERAQQDVGPCFQYATQFLITLLIGCEAQKYISK